MLGQSHRFLGITSSFWGVNASKWGSNPRPLDPESEALTTRPPHSLVDLVEKQSDQKTARGLKFHI